MLNKYKPYLKFPSQATIIYVIFGFVIAKLSNVIALDNMRPPFFIEYNNLQEEIYLFYNNNKRFPAVSELTNESQRLLETKISYAPDTGLKYQYEKKYPLNIPVLGFFTFGKLYSNDDSYDNTSLPPDILIHNYHIRYGNDKNNN